MSKVPITARGERKLREKLRELKTVARPRVINAIADARALGDLKENAEYQAAKEQQSFIEGRIVELEKKLSKVEIIDVASLNGQDKVVFGATVDLLNEQSEEEVMYQIVGEDEVDVKANLISISSPMARALIGKRVGDIAEVQTPRGGVQRYEVVAIRYI